MQRVGIIHCVDIYIRLFKMSIFSTLSTLPSHLGILGGCFSSVRQTTVQPVCVCVCCHCCSLALIPQRHPNAWRAAPPPSLPLVPPPHTVVEAQHQHRRAGTSKTTLVSNNYFLIQVHTSSCVSCRVWYVVWR